MLAQFNKTKLKNTLFSMSEFRDAISSWYKKTSKPLPWRLLWKKKRDPYHVWISEIMLQQTTMKVVLPAYERFIKKYPDVFSLASASEEEVLQYVRGLGYYRRFRLMHCASKRLASVPFRWPKTYSDWKELPGIGDYTAAAISSIAFGERKGVVDGNVERVSCRIFDIRLPSNSVGLTKDFQTFMDELTKVGVPGDLNQAMMELGQTICLYSSPLCSECPVKFSCLSFKRGSQSLAPQPKEGRKSPVKVALELYVLKKGSRFGLIKRSLKEQFLPGTRGFPFFKKEKKSRSLGSPRKIGSFRHTITHHQIKVDVMIIEEFSKLKLKEITWHGTKDLEKKLLSNLDRKAWQLASKWNAPGTLKEKEKSSSFF